MEKTIYVNRPASRTWNRLGVNEAAVRWDTDAEALLSNERFTAVSGENAPLRIEAADGGAAYGRRVYTVTAEAGAELTVFEVCTAAQPLAAELRLTAAEGAHLRVVQLLNPARGAVLRHELSAQLAEHGDGVRNAAGQRIIGIHQQNSGIRIYLGIFLKGFVFVLVVHYPAMGHSPSNRNVELLASQNGSCSSGTGNIGSSGTIDRSIHIMSTAGTKVRYSSIASGPDNTAGFGSNQGLMVDQSQQGSFHQLGIYQVCYYSYARLIRIHNSSLWESIYITSKTEIL